MSALQNLTDEAKAELKEALTFIKNCDYKGTAVKVELEAQLNRPMDVEDYTYCHQCDGDGYHYCHDCDDGLQECPEESCEDGYVEINGEEARCPNGCEEGWISCETCDGDNREECTNCDGNGEVESDAVAWHDDRCQEFILEHVTAPARNALIYGRFYNDGSVDSEYTFTLPIDKAHLVVQFIEAFKALAQEINTDRPDFTMNTSGAGMHIAILNSSDGNYPGGNSLTGSYTNNFIRAMKPLLPALYFLASPDHKSRGLRYRGPKIETCLQNKYTAISGSHGVFEYRIFETCYDRPLAFIDNMIVIAKTLRYYKSTPTDTSLKIGNLGIKDGQGIDRFYYSVKHIEALDKGLAVLKPDYKTITQLKRERNFTLSQAKFKQIEDKREIEWRKEFEQVKKRRHFERLRLYHNGVAKAYEQVQSDPSFNVQKYAKEYVDRYVNNSEYNLKGGIKDYLAEKNHKFMTENIAAVINV